jgi:hypothetical protein
MSALRGTAETDKGKCGNTAADRTDCQTIPDNGHHYNLYWCEDCQGYHTAPVVRADKNLFRPKLMTVTAYLKGRGHLSYMTLQAVMKDIPEIRIGRISGEPGGTGKRIIKEVL